MDVALGLSEGGWRLQVQPALWLSLLLLLLCLEACRWLRDWRRSGAGRRSLPGPFPWPLVGNALQLGDSPHLTFARMARRYGDLFQIRLGRRRVVVLNGEATIRRALVQRSAQFAGRPDFASFRLVSGGRSLAFGRYSEQWRLHRRLAQSTLRAFCGDGGAGLLEQCVSSEACRLIEAFLRLGPAGRPFEPAAELAAAAANVMCSLCFGRRCADDDREFRRLLGLSERFGRAVGAGSLLDVMPWLRAFPNPVRALSRDFERLNRDFYRFVGRQVARGRATYRPGVRRHMSDALMAAVGRCMPGNGGNAQPRDEGEAQGPGRLGLEPEYVESSVSDLLGAAQDTTSAALSWILFHLVRLPGLQSRLGQELDRVVGRERLPRADDRSRLPSLEAFIYETLRYSSFVPLTIPHATTAPVELDGYRLPADTVVFVNQWSVNHDRRKWAEPGAFEPSRFLRRDGSLDRELAASVMLFSAGKRRCLGEQLSKTQLFLFTAILLHQCAFRANPAEPLGAGCTSGLTIRPRAFTLSVTLRDKQRGIVSPA
ncbi:cytochrome P450 1B1 [Chiloscyllium plagiosum]|uniref:cytochrome P450 1B1 n=1 Tax=Chiloscyllium plagiosum TaxID=36176 RepID=UPI001CB819A6|nr:cytochrome P450 1B1 [Chiloscyllium plagiosum]